MEDQLADVVSVGAYSRLFSNGLSSRRKIAETTFDGWKVVAYFGTTPQSTLEMPCVSFFAIARTDNWSLAGQPDLSKSTSCMRVRFGQGSVIWMSASSRVELTRLIKTVYRGFRWRPPEHT